MIAAATTAEVKIFGLSKGTAPNARGIKVRKLEASHLSKNGARLVQFSPDGRWLLVIRMDRSIYLYHVSKSGHDLGFIGFSKPTRLGRQRGMGSMTTHENHGSHGTYGEIVTRVTWSDDGRIIAVSDIDGWIDSWCLQDPKSDHEDSETNGLKSNGVNTSSEDSSDEEAQGSASCFRWTSNPSASRIPRCASPPVVLSFRPVHTEKLSALTNGHATTTQASINALASSVSTKREDRLIVITAGQEILEYRMLSGGFSEWSRRNQPSLLPLDFRILKDRAMGCLWDVRRGRERLWVYGIAWVWMFNLSRDLGVEAFTNGGTTMAKTGSNQKNLKRKRHLTPAERLQSARSTSGAGDQTRSSKLRTGIGKTLRVTRGAAGEGESRSVDLDMFSTGKLEDSKDHTSSLEDVPQSLTEFRRRSIHELGTNGLLTPSADTVHHDEAQESTLTDISGPVEWHTFKYRPIVGIVALADGEVTERDGNADMEPHRTNLAGIEVAIIERPAWDLDLPPRWEGDQEWNK